MEPITSTLTTAKEIYEAAKIIQKVYNVSKEMKTVAESEGKDQIMATKQLADTAVDIKQEPKNQKGDTSSKEIKLERDFVCDDNNGSNIDKAKFVDKLEPTYSDIQLSPEAVEFVNKLSPQTDSANIESKVGLSDNLDNNTFVEKLPIVADADNITEKSNKNQEIKENKIERDPTRFSEDNQYADSEKCQEYRNNPNNEPLVEGCEKDPDVLRHNMELVMGEDASEINKSNSRAHHIVGDNEYSKESQAILKRYGIDINAPENGIFLPQDETSDLHGTIHNGKHTKTYNDEVTQRLRAATCKEDVLEILDSIKEDLYNGEMELYNTHKYNS